MHPDKVMTAARLASAAHFDKTCGLTGEPYIFHVARVAGLTSSIPGATPEHVCVAWLQDIIRNTNLEYTDIENEFNEFVARQVDVLDREADLGLGNEERSIKYYSGFGMFSPFTKTTKVISRLDFLNNAHLMGENTLDFYIKDTAILIRYLSDAHPIFLDALRSRLNHLLAIESVKNRTIELRK